MQKLGYIVSKRKINNLVDFVEVVDDITKINDPSKPFLVVGYKEARELFGDFNVLEKRIKGEIFWTFSKTEKRTDHERDIDNFYNYIINNIIYNIKYNYINILLLKYNKFKKLYNILFNTKDKNYIYFYKNMIYIYYNKVNIIGISLDILNYLNISTEKVFNKLKQNKNNIIYKNDYFLSEKIKKIIINKKYLIAYFMSLNN